MIELRGVHVRFSTNGTMQAARDVSLTARDGRTMVMIGETGSGKSVLLSAILRLLPPTAAVRGEILLDGLNLLALPEKEMTAIRGKRIGYIPQGNGAGMNPLLRTGYQVGEPLMEHKGFSRREAVIRSIELLAQFGLDGADKVSRMYPHQLSGGMRQRAMIAMGMAADAEVVLADEPTKGLDHARTQRVVESFAALRGKTMLCVTHDLGFAEQIADALCVLYASELVEFADREALIREPLHPYTHALLMAQPKHGLRCEVAFASTREAQAMDACVFHAACPRRQPRCAQRPPLFQRGGRKVRCWLYAD